MEQRNSVERPADVNAAYSGLQAYIRSSGNLRINMTRRTAAEARVRLDELLA